MRSGIVLAGGRSTRFDDGDKALASINGQPMIVHICSQIIDSVDELIVNCREDQRSAIEDVFHDTNFSPKFAIDESPDIGPVGGMLSGLSIADEYAAVVACDIPFISNTVLNSLFSYLSASSLPENIERTCNQPEVDRYDAVLPKLNSGWYQPTAAVYRSTPVAQACRCAIEQNEQKALAPLEYLNWVSVPEQEVTTSERTFQNVNTTEELAAAKQYFE